MYLMTAFSCGLYVVVGCMYLRAAFIRGPRLFVLKYIKPANKRGGQINAGLKYIQPTNKSGPLINAALKYIQPTNKRGPQIHTTHK